MFKLAGGLAGVSSSIPRFALAKPHPFVDALTVNSQLLERVGSNALSDRRNKPGMQRSGWIGLQSILNYKISETHILKTFDP